jgi:hypothetical protein
MERVKPSALLGLKPAPATTGLVAVPSGEPDKDIAAAAQMGGTDVTSGATRVADRLNFKDEYAPKFLHGKDRAQRATSIEDVA